MGNFIKGFEASVKLGEIKERPLENALQYLKELLHHFGVNDKQKVNEALQFFYPKICKKGSFYLQAGEVCERIGFITHGAVEACSMDNDKEQVLHLLLEEDFFTDLSSFINQHPSDLSLKFTEDSIILEISHKDFRSLLAKYPEFSEVVIKILSKVVRAYNEHCQLLKLPSRAKYEKMLQVKPQVFNRFLIQDIASFLGVKQETLSRARSLYKKQHRTLF